MVVVWQPPSSDRGFTWQFICIDHPSMAERPLIRAPAALAILCRSEVSARRAHAWNRQPLCRPDVDPVSHHVELFDKLTVLFTKLTSELAVVVEAVPYVCRLLLPRRFPFALDRARPPHVALRTQRSIVDNGLRSIGFEIGDTIDFRERNDWITA